MAKTQTSKLLGATVLFVFVPASGDSGAFWMGWSIIIFFFFFLPKILSYFLKFAF